MRGSYGSVLAMKNGVCSSGHFSDTQPIGSCQQQALGGHLLWLSDHVGLLGGHCEVPGDKIIFVNEVEHTFTLANIVHITCQNPSEHR